MSRFDLLKLLTAMALRSVENHRAKTAIVGSIMFFGAFLWTMGSSLLGSLDRAMSRTIVDSVSGHLQIYEKDTRDSLQLFGGATFGAPDIGDIPSFQALESALADVPNVAALVPMGTTVGLLANDSDLDRALGDLRRASYGEDASDIAAAAERVRYLIGNLKAETLRRSGEGSLPEPVLAGLRSLDYALSASFWTEFAADRLGALEFLDTRIAPLGAEGTLIYMRLLGTDLSQFRNVFSQFELVEGEFVPPGERGLLLSTGFLREIKNRVARELDRMQKDINGGETFAASSSLRDKRDRNIRQYRRALTAFDPGELAAIERVLRSELPDISGGLDELLQAFLDVDDSTFGRRYDLFYREIAPRMRLFPIVVGETATMRGFTRSGYMRGVNVNLYGTFRFRGMEESDLAGVYNLIDMSTFRDLYGAPNPDQQAELAALQADLGLTQITRDDAEAALFGGDIQVEEVESGNVDLGQLLAERDAIDSDRAGDARQGLALHAAVVLQDPNLTPETQAAVQAALDAAELNLRVVDWQTAAGWIGQMTIAMRMVLVFSMAIIFLVALVVMNNTVLISTMERVNEIGTLRAIGAQRSFVLWMFLIETAVIAGIGALLGAAVGAGLLVWLGQTGIPAFAHEMNFMFGGPRLYPNLSFGGVVVSLAVTVTIALVATFFPARHAARIQPVEAMHARE